MKIDHHFHYVDTSFCEIFIFYFILKSVNFQIFKYNRAKKSVNCFEFYFLFEIQKVANKAILKSTFIPHIEVNYLMKKM